MTKLALGTVQFGMDYGINSGIKVEQNEVLKIVNLARKSGITLIDTAQLYGSSEKVLGNVNTVDFDIVTKSRAFEQDIINENEANLVINDLDHSLKLLKQKSLYAFLVHHGEDLLKPGGEMIFNKLQILKEQGLVKKIGFSAYIDNQLIKIIERFDIDIIQLPMNILDNRLINNGLLNKLYSRGIEIHTRSVFLQGLLLMDMDKRPKYFDRWSNLWKFWYEWLTDNKLSPLEASIRYMISKPEISRVLVGVDNKEQLKNIINASDGNVPTIPEELKTDDPDLLNPGNWVIK
ncbi:MAG: aldo/keto reductase [Dehalococcoidia bacterium]|nr:aldo/keto reductase [Dehalococcoidia bacterium]|tara:strand:- start:89 stop:961 length:873 start_codon:yes stop_codon:yes gene_type:complete